MLNVENKNNLARGLVFRAGSLVITAVFLVSGLRAQSPHSAPPPGAAVLTADGMRADLAVFRSGFFAQDVAYSAEARAEAEDRLAALEEELESVSAAQFELRLAQIVALADNGHTISFAHPRASRYNRIPVRLAVFGEDFYVVRATEANANLLGGKLVAIDDLPISTIRDEARGLSGGIPSRRDRDAPFFIESPEQLHALDLVANSVHATYTFYMPNGERVEQTLGGAAAPQRPGSSDRWLYPEPMDGEAGEWQALLDVEQVPWSLQDPDESFRSMDLPALDAMLIEFRRNYNGPDTPIATALRVFRQVIEDSDRANLVLDMRQNGGGDLNTTRDFMEALPDLVPGRIFVLVSPWTFSAAISSVGYLKQTAPDRVTIVGEGPGDRLEFFAEGGMTVLTNSGVMLLAATERHDYRTGCEGFSDCHGSVVRHPIAVDSLVPDINAPWTFEAYASGLDPGMEVVEGLLRGSPH